MLLFFTYLLRNALLKDDRASLRELHDILKEGGNEPDLAGDFFPEPSQDSAGVDMDSPSYFSGYGSGYGSGTSRVERRRSLPARTSVTSMVSLASLVSKVSEGETDRSDGSFQVRRRRAAKLTQFFGVDYRDLVRDVLDSIEDGVQLEETRGRIDKQEAEVGF